jgi:hypothetical protein
VEISTNDEVMNMPLFHMNKIKMDTMRETINEYIETGTIRPFNSALNALAFLVEKQHGPEETCAPKKRHVVEHYL